MKGIAAGREEIAAEREGIEGKGVAAGRKGIAAGREGIAALLAEGTAELFTGRMNEKGEVFPSLLLHNTQAQGPSSLPAN